MQAIHGSKANIKKGDWYKTLDISAGAPSVQMTLDKQEHANRRRIMAPAFSQKALDDAEKLINVHALKLAAKIAAGTAPGDWSSAQNIGTWTTWYGFDFVADLGYGSTFDMLATDTHRWIPNCLKSASKFLYYVGYLPFAALIRPLMGTSVQDYIGGQEAADSLKYTNLANSRLASRIALEESHNEKSIAARKDTFYYLITSVDPFNNRRFTIPELQADSALIIAAGSDGVGLTLAATIFYLLRYPETLAKLTGELRTAFPSAESIQNPRLGSLVYLSACIDEALRLCPPKASTLPREILKGGMIIDGEHFPHGINVGTPIYVLHHNPEIYPEPFAFRPERWLDRETSAAAKEAFCPFLIGPMNCIGKSMAYLAIKCALAQLIWRYEIKAAGEVLVGGGGKELEEGRERENEYQMLDYILGFRDGPLVQLKERV
ncbi:MAG: hypothetical protein Q9227_002306 [Pyrenula ochraceoflavens]